MMAERDTYPVTEGQYAGYEVGKTFTLSDEREYGPWWRFGRAQAITRRLADESSEFGFAYNAVNQVGEVKFAKKSTRGNGMVRVNAHGPNWRCLMFEDVEQGLAYLDVEGNRRDGLLGYEYLRTMAASALAFGSLVFPSAALQPQRMLFVGLGTGALPGFFAHHLPLVDVECVEIDPVVVDAARCELGSRFVLEGERLPVDGRGSYRVAVRDAAVHLRRLVRQQAADRLRTALLRGGGRGGEAAAVQTPPQTAIFLDAYDGKGNIPAYLRSRRFLSNCHDVLAEGGVVVCNCFNGATGSAARASIESFVGELEAVIGPVFTVPVAAQPESLVLVARKGGAPERPGRRDLNRAARRWSAGTAGGGGGGASVNLGFDVSALTSGMLWTRVAVAEDATNGRRSTDASYEEAVPPATTKGLSRGAVERLLEERPSASSACEWSTDRVGGDADDTPGVVTVEGDAEGDEDVEDPRTRRLALRALAVSSLATSTGAALLSSASSF